MKDFKIFNFLILILITLALSSCSEKNPEDMHKIHWDRDMCERCQMVISEKHFAVQIINKKTHKAHMFDDIGCTVLWFKEENHKWFKEAKIWIADAKNGDFIDAREASYTKGNLTPMGYGLKAYSKDTIPKDKEVLSFLQAVENIKKQDELYQKRKKEVLKRREGQKSE